MVTCYSNFSTFKLKQFLTHTGKDCKKHSMCMKIRDNRSPVYFSSLLTSLKERLGTNQGLVKTLKSETITVRVDPCMWNAISFYTPE